MSKYPAIKIITSFVLIMIVNSCSESESQRQNSQEVAVLAGKQAYLDKPELETLWYGTLRPFQREGVPPPNRRVGLYYRLDTKEKTYDVYTGQVVSQLEGFLNRTVTLKGKLLLGSDNTVMAQELWPAAVYLNSSAAQAGVPELLPCATDERNLGDKIHPRLKEVLETRPGIESKQVIVTFCEYLKIPPQPDSEYIAELREPTYTFLATELENYDAVITEKFWLINGVVIDVPLRYVREIAARADTQYLEPSEDGSSPP